MSDRRPVRGVIFDLDGTLGETLPVCFAAFRSVFERDHGVTYDDAAIRQMFGPSDRGVLAANGHGDPDDLLAEYLAEYAAHHSEADEPFPGIVDVLDALRPRVPVAVVTGKGRQSALLSLRHWGILDKFAAVMAGGDDGDIKIENMQAVVATWGVAPKDVVAIGDIDLDVHRARIAGIRPVSAAWSNRADITRLEGANPEALFMQVGDFWQWLKPQLADHGSQSRPSGQKVK